MTIGAIFRAVGSDKRGIAAIEFVVVVPVIIAILVGLYNIGNVIQIETRLAQAAQAGGEYATSYPGASTANYSQGSSGASDIAAIAYDALPLAFQDNQSSVTIAATSGGANCANCPTSQHLTITVSRNFTSLPSAVVIPLSASYDAQIQ